MKYWKDIPERGTNLGIYVIFLLAKFFGYWPALICTFIPVTFDFILNSQGRKYSRIYLKKIKIIHDNTSWIKQYIAIYKHFFSFATCILDRIFLWNNRIDLFKYSIEGIDEVINNTNQGALFVGAHIGSFDFLRILAINRQISIRVVMYTQASEKIISILKKINPTFQLQILDASKGLETIFEIQSSLEKGDFIALLADRHPQNSSTNRGLESVFLNSIANFPTHAWLIANSLACPVYYVSALRIKKQFYHFRIKRLAEQVKIKRKHRHEDLNNILKHYINELEFDCKQAPFQWFNFICFWNEDPQ